VSSDDYKFDNDSLSYGGYNKNVKDIDDGLNYRALEIVKKHGIGKENLQKNIVFEEKNTQNYNYREPSLKLDTYTDYSD
jgi:hypothetical protein